MAVAGTLRPRVRGRNRWGLSRLTPCCHTLCVCCGLVHVGQPPSIATSATEVSLGGQWSLDHEDGTGAQVACSPLDADLMFSWDLFRRFWSCRC